MNVRVYQHDGHPDTAAQYSQGGVSKEWNDVTLEDIAEDLQSEGAAEVDFRLREFPPRDGFVVDYQVNIESEDTVTLTVWATCSQEDHDSEDCECWEYVKSITIEEEPDND